MSETVRTDGSKYLHSKGLVKIHVADVSATGCRVCEANLGVQVRTIEVDLATILVDNLAGLRQRMRIVQLRINI